MRWVCCLVGLALFAACSKDSGVAGSTIETENTVAMDVLFADGTPAARTKVFVRPDDYLAGAKSDEENLWNGETDDNGRLELKGFEAGSYVVEARGELEKAAYRLEFADTMSTEIQVTMKAAGSLKGVVNYDKSRLPVKVSVVGLDYVVETDSLGNFEFKSLPEGNFDVVAFEYAKLKHCVAGKDGELECSTYDRVLNIASAPTVIKTKESDNIVIAYIPQPVKKDTVEKDTLPADTTPVYPHVMFEDFEDSTYGWYTAYSRYATGKLSADEAGFGREGLVAHFEYSNDSLYNWVLMGTGIAEEAIDFSEMDSIVFYARGNGDMMISLDKYQDSVFIKTWNHYDLDSLAESEENPWVRICVQPTDFFKADSSGGNMGWDAVKDSIVSINFFGGSRGSEFWIDDIEIFGVKGLLKEE